MTIVDLCGRVLEADVKHGWKPADEHAATVHMLIVTEIAEATEAVRNGEPHIWFTESGKPEGEAIELADAVIRIAGYFAHKGWNLQAALDQKLKYNEGRPFRHGGKKF